MYLTGLLHELKNMYAPVYEEFIQSYNSLFSEARLSNVITVGDFNTYKDFDLPLSLLAQLKSVANSVCYEMKPKYRQKYSIVLNDAWAMLNPSKKGLTFSNMVGQYFI